MRDFAGTVGGTRGSALYTDSSADLRGGLEELFRFHYSEKIKDQKIQQVRMRDGDCEVTWREVRPIPEANDFFENIWRQYRENQNIY